MKILVISSSVREKRNTHMVASALSERMREKYGIDAELVDLKEVDLPPLHYLYKAHPKPPKQMGALYDKFMECDGYIFVSPEHNGSYAAALKNAVDHFPKEAYFKKPIGISTVSTGGMGGMRAALQMQLLVLALKAFPMPEMLLTPNVTSKFDKGELTDEDFIKTMDRYIENYIWYANALVEKRIAEK
jgi:NAD(P)H-dependent FMN reductase